MNKYVLGYIESDTTDQENPNHLTVFESCFDACFEAELFFIENVQSYF